MPKVRKKVLYSGRVQGVGFRFTTVRLAEPFDVTGYVKNLPDGRVETLVEGEGEVVDSFLADLEKTMERNITSKTEEDLSGSGRYETFDVQY